MGSLLSKPKPEACVTSNFGPAVHRDRTYIRSTESLNLTTPGSFDEDPATCSKDHASPEPDVQQDAPPPLGLYPFLCEVREMKQAKDRQYNTLISVSDWFERITGPSIDIFVGPDEVHFSVPRGLLFYHSRFAERAIEGFFLEAQEKILRLPEDDPDVFFWLVQWMFQGRLGVLEHFKHYKDRLKTGRELWHRWREHACRILCRLSILAERVLDESPTSRYEGSESIHREIALGLDELFRGAADDYHCTPVAPDIVLEVWANTVRDEDNPNVRFGADPSLRQHIFEELCLALFSRAGLSDCAEYAECFMLDNGQFGAKAMAFMMDHYNEFGTIHRFERWGEEGVRM